MVCVGQGRLGLGRTGSLFIHGHLEGPQLGGVGSGKYVYKDIPCVITACDICLIRKTMHPPVFAGVTGGDDDDEEEEEKESRRHPPYVTISISNLCARVPWETSPRYTPPPSLLPSTSVNTTASDRQSILLERILNVSFTPSPRMRPHFHTYMNNNDDNNKNYRSILMEYLRGHPLRLSWQRLIQWNVSSTSTISSVDKTEAIRRISDFTHHWTSARAKTVISNDGDGDGTGTIIVIQSREDLNYISTVTAAHAAKATYLPLGPMAQFKRVYPEEMIPVQDRRLLFNFLGAVSTNILVRAPLIDALSDVVQTILMVTVCGEEDDVANMNGGNSDCYAFRDDHGSSSRDNRTSPPPPPPPPPYPWIHTPRCLINAPFSWELNDPKSSVYRKSQRQLQETKYLSQQEYRSTLLDSVFTFAPPGESCETYRIWEAVEAGSIPIILLGHNYDMHRCADSLAPLLVSKAPFIFLESWEDIHPLLEEAQRDYEKIREIQMELILWYRKYLTGVAGRVEQVLETKLNSVASTLSSRGI